MKNCLLGLVSTLAWLGASSSFAEYNLPNQITLSAGIGYYGFSSGRNLNDATAFPKVNVAYNLDSSWAVEGAYSKLWTSSTDNTAPRVKSRLFLVDGIYRFFKGPYIEPYVSFGSGVLYLNPNGNSPSSQMNLNVGLGAQAFFSKHIALQGEVKTLHTLANNRNDVMFNASISFLLDTNPLSYLTSFYKF